MHRKYYVPGELNFQAGLPRVTQCILLSLVAVLSMLVGTPIFAQSIEAGCPDLTPFYPDDQADWPALSQQLETLFPICLDSAEFFALYGAAQLNNGNVSEASESLERALLLEPDNGAAQIDYAQALYLQGQLFSALELNKTLLERGDLPANLQAAIQKRQRSWQALTTERSAELAVLAGYDNNLNGAPDSSEITLVLSGEPILLALNEDFRAESGPFLNFRLGGRYRQLAPEFQHNWQADIRGRVSDDTESDLLQLDGRYTFIKPGRKQNWQLNTGISHLQFGGSSLYTATDIGVHYQRADVLALGCKPYYGLAVQHQFFNSERQLNAIESKASAGLNCPLASSWGRRNQIAAEVSLLANTALESARPGGDRNGWQMNLDWQTALPVGVFRTRLSYTQLNDAEGYTPLLANGADRWLSRSYLLLQYRRPLFNSMTLMVNMYHQDQRSNIELFKSIDSSIEIGISLPL
jgi:hypothetical protein